MAPARKLMICSITRAECYCGLSSEIDDAQSRHRQSPLKGAPLHTGVIVFSPDTSRGETRKIAISKIESDGTSHAQNRRRPASPAAGIASASSPLPIRPPATTSPRSRTFPKNIAIRSSMLQCEVKPNRDNHLDINLTEPRSLRAASCYISEVVFGDLRWLRRFLVWTRS